MAAGVVAVTVAALTSVHDADPATGVPPPDTGRSLRVLTFNAAFLWADLPGLCGSIDLNGSNIGGVGYQERAAKIASAILQTDNDVVVLNEVFSPATRSTLVTLLQPAYPNYISKISKQLTVELNNAVLTAALGPLGLPCTDALKLSPTTTVTAVDSGLMVFVKNGLEFAPFSAGTAPPYDVATVEGRNKGGAWGLRGQIAVDTYEAITDFGDVLDPEECSGIDCFSSKAAAMVRVRNATNGDVFNIAFSHMQAEDGFPQLAAREKQVKAMRDLVRSSLTPSELSSQPVYVTGDLNIPGENKDKSKPASEWTKFFDSAASSSGRFFACKLGPCTFSPGTPGGSVLTDAWGFETSTADRGVTNAEDDTRLDYFLHNHNLPRLSSKLCVQHVMRAYDLEQAFSPLSDHLGVRVDLNARDRHCSPNDDAGVFGPRKIKFGTLGLFVASDTIRQRGGMKWFKLEKGAGWGTGSYVFTLKAAAASVGVDLDVYESTDLSQPIPMFKEQPGGRGVKYSLPNPPYYVRVFITKGGVPDRTRGGGFTLSVRENRGLTPSDAIGIRPGHEYRYPWPALVLFNDSATQDGATFAPDTQVWHELYTGKSMGGAFPDVTFLSENTLNLDTGLPNSPFSMRIRRETAPYAVLEDDLSQTPGDNGQTTAFHDYDRDGRRDYLLDAPPLTGSGSSLRRYFLTLSRNGPSQHETIRSVTKFRTTLTFVKSIHLKILEEVTAGPAADASHFQWAYDLSGTSSCQTVPPLVCYGPVTLDDGYIWHPPHPSFNGSFAKRLRPRVWEDGELLKPRFSSIVQPLSAGSGDSAKLQFVWAAGASNADDADYWYQLHFCLHHEKDWVANCKLTE